MMFCSAKPFVSRAGNWGTSEPPGSSSTPKRAAAGLVPASRAALPIMHLPEPDSRLGAATSAAFVERVRCSEIVPIEIGDLWVDEAVLRDRMFDWGFVPALRRAIAI